MPQQMCTFSSNILCALPRVQQTCAVSWCMLSLMRTKLCVVFLVVATQVKVEICFVCQCYNCVSFGSRTVYFSAKPKCFQALELLCLMNNHGLSVASLFLWNPFGHPFAEFFNQKVVGDVFLIRSPPTQTASATSSAIPRLTKVRFSLHGQRLHSSNIQSVVGERQRQNAFMPSNELSMPVTFSSQDTQRLALVQ